MMRAGAWGTLLAVLACCTGCASQPVAPVVSAVAPGQARISITRANEGPSWSAAAQIDINGAHVVALAPGQSYSGGVPPGPVTMTATANMDIGKYVVKFNAVAGKTYAFEVSNRGAHTAAGLFGGVAGMVLETAASGDQSGAFQITEVAQ
jgi:hypothetical protein